MEPKLKKLYFFGAPTHCFPYHAHRSAAITQTLLSECAAYTGLNVGNMVIANYFKKTVQYDVANSYDPVTRKALDFIGVENEINFINRNFDAFVVISANFLYEGFSFEKAYEVLNQIQIPFLVVGLGAQSNIKYSQDFLNHPNLKKNIKFFKLLSDRSNSISVRGEFTADCLNKLGIKNVDVTGCPSWYVHGYEYTPIQKNTEIRKITCQTAIHSSSTDLLTNSLLLEISRTYRTSLLLQDLYGPELSLIKLTNGLGDTEDLHTIKKFLGRDCDFEDGKLILKYDNYHAEISPITFFDVADWEEFIRQQDLVFGKRVHGSIVSIQNGVPSVLIVHDSRTRELSDIFSIPSVNISQLNHEFNFPNMFEELDFSKMNSKYPLLLENYRNFLIRNDISPVLETTDPDYYKNALSSYVNSFYNETQIHKKPSSMISDQSSHDRPAGQAQIFLPTESGYLENKSFIQTMMYGSWAKMVFNVECDEICKNKRIRFDPINRPAIIEIQSIKLWTAEGKEVFRFEGEMDRFDPIQIEGTALKILTNENLVIFSYSEDPILYLPAIETEVNQTFTLEIVQRVENNYQIIFDYIKTLELLAVNQIEFYKERVTELESQITNLKM